MAALVSAIVRAGRAMIALGCLFAVLLPAEALACPSCALRENTPGRMLVLVGMILLPFGVVAGSLFLIRRMVRSEAAIGPDGSGGSDPFEG